MAKLTLFLFLGKENEGEGEGHKGGYWGAMWYVIQTVTGKEEELVSLIRKQIDGKWYDSCFVIQAEWMKRLGGSWRIQVRPLFPGYVFIDTERPGEVFWELKGILQFARILGGEKGEFAPVEEEEKRFLERLMGGGVQRGKKNRYQVGGACASCKNSQTGGRCDRQREHQEDHWLRISIVEISTKGEIVKIYGPLKQFDGKIERINLHKRFAVVKVSLAGRERTVKVGVVLRGDNGER